MSENVEEIMIHIFQYAHILLLTIHAVVYDKSSWII